ncbi:PH domain-containing protein [Streptomyces sp. SID3343]|uniref:PH domain-containing protein n=1 Tax=Streptomyces sp. SID3343 TaxID=2690260 RepID=UPI00136C7D42|nr:PH domain-containing protein [Streptomyces sp. SID3343]MYV97889.1 PH domain-containing protein [Streptomyces sp. SID3343]
MKPADDALAPPDLDWRSVSEHLFTMRRALLLGACFLVAVAGGGPLGYFVVWWAGLALAAGCAVLGGWGVRAIRRNQRSWRYAEREDDLLIEHGVQFRRLVVVPYGRMQFVDVEAGPLERRFKIATVTLHTASASSDAVVRGLPPQEAARLRDRLAALGEARSAGL